MTTDGPRRLWTIQTHTAWQHAQQKGILRTDGRRVERTFRPAYRWMMRHMQLRLPNYRGGYPVWAWYAPKPDLRASALLPRGTRGVRIEFEAPAHAMLLSNFDAWHCVLNGSYLALCEDEYHKVGAKFTAAQVEQSWTRIFDLQKTDLYIQAVVEQITLSQVVRVDTFVAR